jgi:hypothetical protein
VLDSPVFDDVEVAGMLTAAEREAIAAPWSEKLSQDARGLPRSERHRNLEPPAAEFISALATGCDALDFVLIDCEKDDYVPFLGLLRLAPGAVVVADNILSHDLEVSRFTIGAPGQPWAATPSNEDLKLTKPETTGASQLDSSVRRT